MYAMTEQINRGLLDHVDELDVPVSCGYLSSGHISPESFPRRLLPGAAANPASISTVATTRNPDEAERCYGRHSDVKAQFSMPFRHNVNRSLILCADCHPPHDVSGKYFVGVPVNQVFMKEALSGWDFGDKASASYKTRS